MPKSVAGRLFLLRHAHSSWALPGQRDHQRPLDERGRREAPLVGRAFRALDLPLERVIVSSAARAQETLDGIRDTLPPGVEFETSDDLYALGPEAYVSAARSSGVAALMLVGHNPMVEEAAGRLVRDGAAEALARLQSGFPTAGLAVIEFEVPLAEIAPGTGRLAAFLRPERA